LNVLHVNDYVGEVGGAEVAVKLLISRLGGDLISTTNFTTDAAKKYDVIHLHSVWNLLSRRRSLYSSRVPYVYTAHGYTLDCTKQSGLCIPGCIPTGSCSTCQGIIARALFSRSRLKPLLEVVRQSKAIIVHSKWMQFYYRRWNPTYLPIPLEIEEMQPLDPSEKERYLFFSARCVFDKNPFAFARLCKELHVKGIMALDFLAGTSRGLFKDYVKTLRNEYVEFYFDPEKEERFDLCHHAYLTVHPHVYCEPFGIASANSILLGTPLIAYPFGNLRDLATITAFPYAELRRTVDRALIDDAYYHLLCEKTLTRRNKLTKELDCVEDWERFYELTMDGKQN